MIAALFLIGVGAGTFLIVVTLEVLSSDSETDRELRAFKERQSLESGTGPEAPVEPDPTAPLSDRIRGALESSKANGTEPPRKEGTDR